MNDDEVVRLQRLFDDYFRPDGKRLAPVSDTASALTWHGFGPVLDTCTSVKEIKRHFVQRFHTDRPNQILNREDQAQIYVLFMTAIENPRKAKKEAEEAAQAKTRPGTEPDIPPAEGVETIYRPMLCTVQDKPFFSVYSRKTGKKRVRWMQPDKKRFRWIQAIRGDQPAKAEDVKAVSPSSVKESMLKGAPNGARCPWCMAGKQFKHFVYRCDRCGQWCCTGRMLVKTNGEKWGRFQCSERCGGEWQLSFDGKNGGKGKRQFSVLRTGGAEQDVLRLSANRLRLPGSTTP